MEKLQNESQEAAVDFLSEEQPKGNLRNTPPEEVKHVEQLVPPNNGNVRPDPKASRCVPRRHTVGGPRSSREILAMQPSDMDRKREAFLEHLKLKYPHHASAIMGHQERLREQSLQCMLSSLHSELDIQRYLLKLESSHRSRSPKHCVSAQPEGGEGEQLSVASLDSLEAMSEGDAPSAFTRGTRSRASLPVVRSANQTKDRSLGVLYLQYGDETKQMRMPNEITSSDTIRALFVSAFPQQLNMKMLESPSVAVYVKDDVRNMYYELTDVRNITDHSCLKVYHKDPAQAFSHNSRAANGDARMHREVMYSGHNSLRQPMPGPLSPPPTLSMPPSPSRIPFGPRPVGMPANTTVPRERLASVPPGRAASPCPSAILERRDVKPDEDVGAKVGSGMYSEPYLLHEARLSVASSTHEPPPDLGPPYPTHAPIYRQRSRKYPAPPPSPHRVMDLHPPHLPPSPTIALERASSLRQSLRKDSGDNLGKTRASVSSPATDVPPALTDKVFMGHVPAVSPNDPQTRERMKAMEQQIASLTGLVQHALLKGPSGQGTKEQSGEKQAKSASPVHSTSSGGASPILSAKSPVVQTENTPTMPTPPGPVPTHTGLVYLRRSVSELRLQMHQMRQQQLQNQENVKLMLKRAEQEISQQLTETLRRLEDPVQKQRAMVEEDRHKYLAMEERVLVELGELEQYVEERRKESTQRSVTLRDVEEGAVILRNVGESLAELKGEFPALQSKMRAVLRVEVEAVKFLKEEPHKLDSMLKRVKSLTEMLGTLRRSATDTLLIVPDSALVKSEVETLPLVESETPPSPSVDPLASCVRSEVMTSSPPVIHRALSSPVQIQQSYQSSALVSQPLPTIPPAQTGNPNPEPLVPACTRNGAATQVLFIEEINNSREKSMQRVMSIEAAERQWEEKRHNMSHYDSREFEKVLQEAQANMMKVLPDLDVLGPVEGTTAPSTVPPMETVVPTSEDSNTVPEPTPEPEPSSEDSDQNPPTEPKVSTEKTSLVVARVIGEKANRSPPPPPPPRRSYPPGTGLTTGRSGEVIFTSRKELVTTQDAEEDATPPPLLKPSKPSPESKPKPATPPPIAASAVCEEEDDGSKIMAELQVFQKCTVKDEGAKCFVEPQVRELRPASLVSPKIRKQKTEPRHEEKGPEKDENGNDTVRQGVIYYVTAQISKDQPPSHGAKEQQDSQRVAVVAPTQVAHANAYKTSQREQELASDMPPPIPEWPVVDFKVGLPSMYQHLETTQPLKCTGELAIIGTPQSNVIAKTEKIYHGTSPSIKEYMSLPSAAPESIPLVVTEDMSMVVNDFSEPLLLGSCKSRDRYVEDTSLSPDLPGEEGPPPPDNIAFMITNSKVQALSCGEYQEIVNTRAGHLQTVKVGENQATTTQESNSMDKKPVIIIFDEPMDIRSAYKRLSTIFECEEEFERMLAEERIEEENEEAESDSDLATKRVKPNLEAVDGKAKLEGSQNILIPSEHDQNQQQTLEGSFATQKPEMNNDFAVDVKQDAKKKFKFKFPKKQLAALSQAIRTGTKSGKKTLQVVVYEEEEELDGTVKQQKEARRFEIGCQNSPPDSQKPIVSSSKAPVVTQFPPTDSLCRTDDIRKSTYKTLDSLEKTIKQLETTISEMGPRSPEEPLLQGSEAQPVQVPDLVPPRAKRTADSSAQPGSSVFKSQKVSHRKKSKPKVLPHPPVLPTATSEQNASLSAATSRMPVPMSAKSRQPQGGAEKAGKQQKLQDPQRQFRQANGAAKKAGGDIKATSPTIPTSKIPAFYPSSGKSGSLSAPNSDTTNPITPPSSSSSKSSSSIPTPHSSRGSPGSSHIPSLSNGSVKHTVKSHALSFSPQTQNGRASSSSSSYSPSSPSPVSPTSLGHGGKSIRTIHTPSFTSYKPLNGTGSKASIPPASSTKDAC